MLCTSWVMHGGRIFGISSNSLVSRLVQIISLSGAAMVSRVSEAPIRDPLVWLSLASHSTDARTCLSTITHTRMSSISDSINWHWDEAIGRTEKQRGQTLPNCRRKRLKGDCCLDCKRFCP